MTELEYEEAILRRKLFDIHMQLGVLRSKEENTEYAELTKKLKQELMETKKEMAQVKIKKMEEKNEEYQRR